jgi:hypothetical protein
MVANAQNDWSFQARLEHRRGDRFVRAKINDEFAAQDALSIVACGVPKFASSASSCP